jgi:hypothetical protein
MKNGGKGAILLLIGLTAFISLNSCQSLAGTVGIATEEYVDERVSEAEGRLTAQIGDNREEIDKFSATADKLEELIGSVEESVRTTEELKQLAVVLEDRLNNLPKETIEQLVEVLQQYLDAQ